MQQLVKRELDKLHAEWGSLPAQKVLRHVEGHEDCPIRDEVGWVTEARAARLYRLQQIEQLIRRYTVHIQILGGHRVKTKRYYKVHQESATAPVINVLRKAVVENEEFQKQIYERAVHRLRSWLADFKHIPLVKPLWEDIEAALVKEQPLSEEMRPRKIAAK